MQPENINAILLLYHHPPQQNAPTIMENVNAFLRHSCFPVFAVNTELGFPNFLRKYQFSSIILHYSLFGLWPYQLNNLFFEYLTENITSYKIAIFQDEYRFCQPRFRFINEYNINCIYTCISPDYVPAFYGKYTRVPRVETVLTGYVSDEMIDAAEKLSRPDQQRAIDISYRGRPLPFYLGKGAQEKTEIAKGFLTHATGTNLILDIETSEEDRIYGTAWYEFLADCRGVLGVESSVSYCDLEGKARPAVEALLAQNPEISFDEVYEKALKQWEGNIPIRTISPRHFEAAALRVCQILYEGEYAGIMKPMEHYIPLKKDFSNFDEVIRLFSDRGLRTRIAENAYRDLVASGKYSYQKFVEKTDNILEENGLSGNENAKLIAKINREFERETKFRLLFKRLEHKIRYSQFMQKCLKPVLRPVLIKTGMINPEG